MKEAVGTELEKLIPKWALQFKDEECKPCKDMVHKMNSWGVKGCTAKRDYIVEHLMSQSKELIPILHLVPAVCKRTAAIMLLNQAIANAKDSGQ